MNTESRGPGSGSAPSSGNRREPSPAETPTGGQGTPELAAPSESPKTVRKVHVLIVDDDPVSRKVLRLVLMRLPDCQITEAVDGRAARVFLEKRPRPDLCISDFRMPGLDGIQLLEHIRANSHLRDMEVVFCSSNTDREVVEKVASLRISGYMRKPLSLAAVVEQLRPILERAVEKRDSELKELQSKLGFDLNDCAEVLQTLSAEILATVRMVRINLADGKGQKVVLQMNTLKGAASVLHDSGLNAAIGSINTAVEHNDLAATLDGLDMLEDQGKQLQSLVASALETSKLSGETPLPEE